MAWLAADWTWPLLSPFLDDDDAHSVTLFALQTRRRSLSRFFVHYDNAPPHRSPLRATRLLHLAVANGCWRAAETIQRELLRHNHVGGMRGSLGCSVEEMGLLLEKQGLEFAPEMASVIRASHYAPVEFPPHVMYEACRRGHLDAVLWLHEVSEYVPHIAIDWAAKARDVDTVRWLLTNRKTAQCVQRGVKITWTIKGKDAKAVGGFYAWNVHIPEERATYGYCMSRRHGLLPRKNLKSNKAIYPLKAWAARQGELRLLQILVNHPLGQDMSTQEAVYRAAENGHLEIVQWFFSVTRPRYEHLENVSTEALANGHLHILQWMEDNEFEVVCSLSSRLALRVKGYTELETWLDETYPAPNSTKQMRKERSLLWDNYLVEAAGSGSLETVRFLHEEIGCAISARAVGEAASNGHLLVVQWLMQVMDVDEPSLRYILIQALKGGHLEVTKWLVHDKEVWIPDLLKLAAADNHVNVMEFVFQAAKTRCQRDNVQLAMVLNLRIDLLYVISKGHVEALDWLLLHVRNEVFEYQDFSTLQFLLTFERYYEANETALGVRNAEFDQRRYYQWTMVAKLSRERVLRGVRALFLTLPVVVTTQLAWLPEWAIRTGSFDVLRALGEVHHPSLFTHESLRTLLRFTRNVSLVQWFVEQERAASLVEWRLSLIVQWAAMHSHVDLLQWLFARHDELKTFRTAAWTGAKHGHVTVLQSVVRHLTVRGIVQHKSFCNRIWKSIASVAVDNGHVEVLEWLKMRSEHSTFDSPLADLAAKHGHLQVLKWLRAKTGGVDVCTVRGLCTAVGNGHADVVAWLTNTEPELLQEAEAELPALETAIESLLGLSLE